MSEQVLGKARVRIVIVRPPCLRILSGLGKECNKHSFLSPEIRECGRFRPSWSWESASNGRTNSYTIILHVKCARFLLRNTTPHSGLGYPKRWPKINFGILIQNQKCLKIDIWKYLFLKFYVDRVISLPLTGIESLKCIELIFITYFHKIFFI